MAKGKKSKPFAKYTKQDLINVIRYLGGEAKSRWNKAKIIKTYRDIHKEQKEKGIELPKLKTMVEHTRQYQYEETPRDDDMNTAPPEEAMELGAEYINNFISLVTSIYNDTKSRVASVPRNSKGNVKDPEFYFLENNLSAVEVSYREILSMVQTMRDRFGDEAVAKALAEDAEIDYTQALIFIPPSDTQNNFEITIEQLTGIMVNLSSQFLG